MSFRIVENMFCEYECQLINHYASTGDVQKLKKIIETTDQYGNDRCGFNTFCPSLNGKHISPLITAVRKGNLKVVKYLVGKPVCLELNENYTKHKPHSTYRDVSEPTTPLFEACYSYNIDMTKLLIELGVDVNMSSIVQCTATHNLRVTTPLIEAASRCRVDIVKCLIANGANIEKTDSIGNTAITKSVTYTYSNLECFKVLLNAGCNPLHKNVFGYTTLHRAASIGKIDVVATLLNFGISPMFQPALPRPANGQYVPCPLFLSINIHSCNAVSHMLMSREDCPVSCKIDALKLRAAKSYICGNNAASVFELFSKAVELEETLNEPLPTHNDSENFYSIEEVHTVQQLNQMYIDERNTPGTFMMQCLVIAERCLGGDDTNIVNISKVFGKAIDTLFAHRHHEQSLTLLSRWQNFIRTHLVKLSLKDLTVDGTYICSWFDVITAYILNMHNSGIVHQDLTNLMSLGNQCYNCLYNNAIPKEGFNNWRCYSFELLYKSILKILFTRVKHNNRALKNCKCLCDEVVDLFCREPENINFFHKFFVEFDFNDEINVQILENFLSNDKVFKNINKMLYKKTIIGTFLSVEKIHKYDFQKLKQIVDLFIDNGAHIDCVDRNGHCLVDLENRSTVVYECLKHKLPLSLMCLSARAVIHQKIDYDILPCHCKQFVSLHDSNNC